ncbi:MAG: endonuclease [Bacteroidota bacterium]|nr:endonuclease [Bacteroidota bacterium]
MLKSPFVFLVILLQFIVYESFSQKLKPHEFPRGDYRIMFYNVENLFDMEDDSLTWDEEFTPEGPKYWTPRKYYQKLKNISKVITAVGQWELPEIVGVCEIENLKVLQDVISKTGLKNSQYRIIHKESPDGRGIDVALFYMKNKFSPLEYEAVPVVYPFEGSRATRDILRVKGVLASGDTIHLFVNHWPSRWGGQKVTDRKRVYAASVLKRKTDSLFSADKNPNIIIMGDLNDYPTNSSLIHTLKAKTNFDNPNAEDLYNLAWQLQEVKAKGSHKYHGEWGVLDQIIISGTLLTRKSGLRTSIDDAHVFDAPFLLEKDTKYVGYITNRTYIGHRYHGGYSDHLPVYIDLFIGK